MNAAIGGSTNAVIHLLAIAGRLGVELELEDCDRVGSATALPGQPAALGQVPDGGFLLRRRAAGGDEGDRAICWMPAPGPPTARASARTSPTRQCWNREVIHAFQQPFKEHAGIAVLRGNLAEHGAVIKPSAASAHLLQHRGRAVVFEDIEDFHARINDEQLDIDEHCIMVLKNCGPKGYPGMAEVGNMPLPPKLLRRGITDMVRISDARMSGTAYGTVVLHVSPEAAAGGTLGWCRAAT